MTTRLASKRAKGAPTMAAASRRSANSLDACRDLLVEFYWPAANAHLALAFLTRPWSCHELVTGADGSGNLKFGRADSPMWLPVASTASYSTSMGRSVRSRLSKQNEHRLPTRFPSQADGTLPASLTATIWSRRLGRHLCVSSDDAPEVGQGLQGCASEQKSGQRRLWFPQLYGSQGAS